MGFITVIDPTGEYQDIFGELSATCAAAEVRSASSVDDSCFSPDVPHVIVIAPTASYVLGIEAARTASAVGSYTSVVVIAPELSTEMLRTAMKAGVADVVSVADSQADISRSVREVYDALVARQLVAISHSESAEVSTGGRLVTIFSTKGGVGKTVLATNLGVALSKVLGLRTAIVDLDLQFGDVGIMLGLTPERTITDVAADIERLDADLLSGHMTKHDSGLDVLLAPTRPEDAETVTTGRISRILSLLREMYDVVVVDTAATLDEIVLTALDRSDSVYALTMMDVASIKNMRISLQKLKQLGYDDSAVRVVLNRADSKVWLEPQEVERAVGSAIFARIPSDRVVPRSVNKGRPVVLDEPKSDVAKAMVAIAKTVAASTQEVATHVA
ncbi:MAG: AAA family ATPase [Coriobacteriia bacterium]|nr:AAA family ATPase [Coriobacteriia bacterium]